MLHTEYDNLVYELEGEGIYFLDHPNPSEAIVGDFVQEPLVLAQTFYQNAAAGYVNLGLAELVAANRASASQAANGGEAFTRLTGADRAAVAGATAEQAAVIAKALFATALGVAAAAAAAKIVASEDPLAEGAKESIAFGSLFLAVEGTTKVLGRFPVHPLAKVVVIGGVSIAVDHAMRQVLEEIEDQIRSQSLTKEQAMELAKQAADDYVEDVWGKTGQDKEDYLDSLSDYIDQREDKLADLCPKDDLPPIASDWVDDAKIPWFFAPTTGSPLVLDLDGDGIELTAFNGTTTYTFFDIDGDGYAEQTAWVGADDGLLARDLDDSGTIDSVDELFGSPAIDGFALLATLDDNDDHVINQYDNVWSDLVVWQDENGDGVTQDGELHSLDSLGIVSIDLAGVTSSTSTINGNPISHSSTFRFDNSTTQSIVDAWFIHDNVNSEYVGEYTLDIAVLSLPTLRGFGKLASLHIAMSQNEDLRDLVQDFNDNWDISRFEDGAALDADIKEILWTWAGVENITVYSRGVYVDARNLEFMEEFFGNEFRQVGVDPNPREVAAQNLNSAWDIIYNAMKAQLIAQVGGAELFRNIISYNVILGDLQGQMTLSQDAIDDLETAAPAPGAALVAYWEEIARFLDATKGLANLDSGENVMLDDAIFATDSTLTWEEIKTFSEPGPGSILYGTSGVDTLVGGSGEDAIYGGYGDDILSGGGGNDIIQGDDGNDTIYGDDGNDELYGGYGDDIIYGGGGADTLEGGDGNDLLSGGAGGNILYGGNGDDVYEYTSGNDYYFDQSGADTILLPSGIDSGDLNLFQVLGGTGGNGFLIIEVDSLGTIQTEFFSPYGGLYSTRIETLMFSDTSTFNFAGITALTTYGTSGNDAFYGVNLGSHVDDTVYGLGGDDQLTTYDGNDTLDGGIGNDRLNGGNGNDTYIASPGFDRIEWDSGGSDTIYIPDGYDAGDLTIIKPSGTYYDVILSIDGLGQIYIEGQLYGGYSIETISFNGVSTMSLTSAQIEQVGSSGSDSLYGITSGASTDDIMDGREGDDYLYGDYGDDTYFFSLGNDLIGEQGGTDAIRFREAWDPEDITIYRIGTALFLEDQNGNSMQVGQQFTLDGGYSNSAYMIEQIVFSDSTTWSMASIEVETRGTSSGDNLTGATGGDASSADTLYGYGGSDSLNGGAGDDVLYGGDGYDTLAGGTGADTFVFEIDSAFNDRDDIQDFSTTDGDVIDLTDILGNIYDPLTDAIADFVSLAESSGSTIVSVDRDGSGSGYSMAEVVRLYGVTGLGTASDLESNGNLLAA